VIVLATGVVVLGGAAIGSAMGGQAASVTSVDLPNLALTPGAVFAGVTRAQVCRPGYSSGVRSVSSSTKIAVYARYHVAWVPYAHEVDHLISLELGGSNAITNLWPEPYAGAWGAYAKDKLENRLHDLVCAGSMELTVAQRLISRHWVAAYRTYVSASPSGSTTTHPTTTTTADATSDAGGFYASSYRTASTIYCADDPAWRDLSKTYLQHFATWADAIAAHPSYHLDQPC
jgi:hypothetical protein